MKRFFSTKEYPDLIRSKSAYYIGANLVSLLKTKESLLWFDRVLETAPKENRMEFEQGILANVQKMTYAQDFLSAYQLAESFLMKACSEKKFPLKNDFFKVYVQYPMMTGEYGKVSKNLESSKKCRIHKKTYFETIKSIARSHVTHKEYSYLDQWLLTYKKKKELRDFSTKLLLEIYWRSILDGDEKGEQYAFTHLKRGNFISFYPRNHAIRKEIQAIWGFNQLRSELAKGKIDHFSFHNSAEKFNEEQFNKELESHIAKIESLTTKISGHIKTGYPQIVSYGHHALWRVYSSFSRSLLEFEPKGVDENYKKSFLKTIRGLAGGFTTEAQRHRKLGSKLLERKDILFANGSYFDLGEDHPLNKIAYRYQASRYPITMDRRLGK